MGFLQSAGVWIDSCHDPIPPRPRPVPQRGAATTSEVIAQPLDLTNISGLLPWDAPACPRLPVRPRGGRTAVELIVLALSPMDTGPLVWEVQAPAPRPRRKPLPATPESRLLTPVPDYADITSFPVYFDSISPNRPRRKLGRDDTRPLAALPPDGIEVLLAWSSPAGRAPAARMAVLAGRAPAAETVAPVTADGTASYFVWWQAFDAPRARVPARPSCRNTVSEPPSWYAAPLSMPTVGPYYVAAMDLSWPGAYAGQVEAE